ncbi:MAG: hypothetical protein ABL973_08800 [Micropepsaceae bacterium]
MTCEVMLMNLQSVVLAADSALTITEPSTRRTIEQPNAKKLAILNASAPIAAMFFGNGDFGGYQWAQIFDSFRENQALQTLSVSQTAGSFVKFLSDLDSDGRVGQLKVEQSHEFRTFRVYVGDVIERLRELVYEHGGGDEFHASPTEPQIVRALEQLRTETLYEASEFGDEIGEGANLRERPLIGENTPRLREFLSKFLAQVMESWVTKLVPYLSAPHRDQLGQIIAGSILTDWIPPSTSFAGIVIAGYSAQNPLPSATELRVVGLMGGVLKYCRAADNTPTTSQGLVIESYAQDSPIVSMLWGADLNFLNQTLVFSKEILHSVFSKILNELPQSQATFKKMLSEQFLQIAEDVPFSTLQTSVRWYHDQMLDLIGPVLESAHAQQLSEYAGRLLDYAVIRHELTGNRGVMRPLKVCEMEKGKVRIFQVGRAHD